MVTAVVCRDDIQQGLYGGAIIGEGQDTARQVLVLQGMLYISDTRGGSDYTMGRVVWVGELWQNIGIRTFCNNLFFVQSFAATVGENHSETPIYLTWHLFG